jgi:transcription termination factor NusB
MGNPIGGLGQASAKMVEEIQKQASQQVQNQQNGSQVNKFNDVMAAQNTQATSATQAVGQVDAPNKAIAALQAAKVNATDASNIGAKPVADVTKADGQGFKKLLGGIVDGQGKLDEIIKMATSGKKFGHQQLLAIQASVYKYSQELELTSKVVEKATSGVKQTMQTQV